MGTMVAVPALIAQQTPPPAAATPEPTVRPGQQPPVRTPTSSAAAQDGFVPVENLPQQESIPAPRLVATAYAWCGSC